MSLDSTEFRTYERCNSIVFRKTNEAFGGLSNMAPGFPMHILGIKIRTSEALYQACRYPHLPDVQRMILNETSPMTAKMRSKPFRDQSRADWDDVRVKIMRWCLRVKLIYNWEQFSKLIISTGEREIVEESAKDAYWGAKVCGNQELVGENVLGRLIMELRTKIKSSPESLEVVFPLSISGFSLLGRDIPILERNDEFSGQVNSLNRKKSVSATLALWN